MCILFKKPSEFLGWVKDFETVNGKGWMDSIISTVGPILIILASELCCVDLINCALFVASNTPPISEGGYLSLSKSYYYLSLNIDFFSSFV